MKLKGFILGLACFTLIPFSAFSIKITDKNWDDSIDIRSISSEPTLSQDDNAIYIYSDKELEDLSIQIKDLSGNIVYSTIATVPAGIEYPTAIGTLPQGNYLFIITQGSKYIVGHFTK